MKWLIRRVIRKGKGATQYEEEIHFGETLTIGRAANQAIFVNDIRAALEHARVIALGNGRYRVEALVTAGVRIDGHFEHSVTAKAGQTIQVANTRITLVDPPKDFEAAVEVALIDKTEAAAREQNEALPQTLAEAGLSKRRASWTLLVLTLAFGLLAPLAAHYVPTFRSLVKEVPALGLNAWNSGPLAAAHHAMARDCQSCHGDPFEVVQDDKCVACHRNTLAHADPVAFPLPEIAEARCAHCHRDHNGDDGLIWDDQVLCSGCHSELSRRVAGKTALQDVSDFGKSHPQFKVLLPAWKEDGSYAPQRVSMDQQPLVERSGLKFPHNKHLVATGVQAPEGIRVLACADCHVAEAGGALMKAIDFESHCQDCHRLDFDLRMPERQVPHAKVAEIQYMLDEFYAKIALEGGYDDVAAPLNVRQRRRPGQQPTVQEQREALDWARTKARETTDALFSSRTCGVCHTVTRDPAASRGGWVVAPVRVSGQWFEKARFNHGRHATMACEDCHAARESSDSSDLLIPDIGYAGALAGDPPYGCRACHGGEDHAEAGQLASTCIDCHGFHQAPFPLHTTLGTGAVR